MQMVRICVCHTYADVRHMDMHDLYAFFSFSAEIRKKVEPEVLNKKTWHEAGRHSVSGKIMSRNTDGDRDHYDDISSSP